MNHSSSAQTSDQSAKAPTFAPNHSTSPLPIRGSSHPWITKNGSRLKRLGQPQGLGVPAVRRAWASRRSTGLWASRRSAGLWASRRSRQSERPLGLVAGWLARREERRDLLGRKRRATPPDAPPRARASGWRGGGGCPGARRRRLSARDGRRQALRGARGCREPGTPNRQA
jgi:hypothetical protein